MLLIQPEVIDYAGLRIVVLSFRATAPANTPGCPIGLPVALNTNRPQSPFDKGGGIDVSPIVENLQNHVINAAIKSV